MQGLVFIPLAVESLGGWHEAVVGEFRKLGGALARHTGQLEGEAISHLFQRLSILLVMGNAAQCLAEGSWCDPKDQVRNSRR